MTNLYGVNDNKSISGSKPKVNDTLKLKIDFENKDVSLYHNDQYISKIYDTVPDCIIPMIGMWMKISITCTQFECR